MQAALSAHVRLRVVAVVLGLLITVAVLAARAEASGYTIKDLGIPPVSNHVRSFGNAVNQSGQAAGFSGQFSSVFGANQRRAFFYDGTSIRTLGTLGGLGESFAYGINASGKVVGWAAATDGNNHAFVYDGVGMKDLGTLGARGFSAAYGINTAGIVVGTSVTRSGPMHAFSHDGKRMTDLGTLPGKSYSEAQAINTSGQIAGTSWNVTSGAVAHRGFVRDSSGMRDIGTLGGADTRAYDINDAGSVVGTSQTASGVWHAFRYSGGVMTDLGGIGGGSSIAYGMNNRGEVVGESGGRAFLHSDNTFVDLNTLLPANSGWFLREAQDITDGGVVVGTGLFLGEYHAFLLSPTLLGRYVPRMRHDLQEVYRPDSAATITDNYTSSYTNRLMASELITIAASDPAHSEADLYLDYLAPTYPGGMAASADHYLDEANDNRDGDAQRLHANPIYANKVYGRQIPIAGGTLLQYWFWFYNNPKTFATAGDHEGDWEMIQVRVDSSGTPVGAAYAQHNVGEYCAWDRMERSQSGRPVVYVAHESHASYFTAGDHRIVVNNLPDQWDYADGAGEPVTPTLVDVTSAPAWMQWPGQWGGADSSPRAPYHQGKWNDPQGFESGAATCTAPLGATSSHALAVPRRPAAPQIEAHRVGNRVIVDYRLAQAAGAEPWLLVTTVDGVADGRTPTSARTSATEVSGRLMQPVGLARGRLRVLASVRAANGARSKVVVVPVR